MGGLPRRATIIDGLKDSPQPPLFVADAGNFAWKSGRLSEAARPQQRRKAEAILDAFARDPIDALGLGVRDLVLGVDWVKQATAARTLPVTLANLSCDGDKPFPGHQRVERGGVTVGFVGVFSDTMKVEGCEVSSSTVALRAELDAMGPVDMLVVFGHGTTEEDEALAEAVAEIDVVINGHGRVTRTSPLPLPNGAIQLGAGSRGKKLGIAELLMVDGADGFSSAGALDDLRSRKATYDRRLESAQRNVVEAGDDNPTAKRRAERQVTYFSEELATITTQIAELETKGDARAHTVDVELVDLNRKVKDHPGVLALLETAKTDIAALEHGAVVAPLGDTPYLGSAACSGCHSEIYQQWQETGHSRAYATLQVEERELDRDCYSCHVTGAFDEKGPQHPAQVTPLLQAVGCESCHGPGREHAKAPAADGKVSRTPGEATCVQCHDGKQDEGRFSFAEYLPKVVHQSP